MRIAIANTARIWGGAEKIMLQLVTGLHERGHEVLLLVRRDAPVAQSVPSDVHALAIPGGVDMNPLGVLKTARALRRWHADLLVIWTTKDLRIAGVGGRLARIPVLVRRAYETDLPRKLRHRFFHEWVPTRYMTNAEATKRTLLRSIPTLRTENVAVIYNGIDIAAIDAVPPVDLGLPRDAIVIGFISRLDKVKGVEELITAWPMVARSVPNAHLVVVGTGELEHEARAALARVERAHVLGFRTDAIGILKSVDVLVLPSYREGTPNIIMEAMVGGRCIVATAVSGTPELVENGVHARLIPPRDSGALSAALIEVATDPAQRARLGTAARERIQEFSFARMIDRYIELFTECALPDGARPQPERHG